MSRWHRWTDERDYRTGLTFRRRFPAWLGFVYVSPGKHICGVYARVGNRLMFLARW